jgi:hypothetical protein
MKSRVFTVLFTLLLTTKAFTQLYSIECSKKINPIAFFKTEKSFLLVADTAIFQLDKKDKIWKPIKLFIKKIKTAAFVKDKLWFGNDEHLFFRDNKNEVTLWKGINEGKIDVLSLKTNPVTQELLVATADDGAFTIKDTTLDRSLVQHIRAEDACNCGGFDWIGTYTGLVRVSKNGDIQIYAEEGVKGFEVPDNLIEHLYCADGKHLLIMIPELLAFLNADEKATETHAEGFGYIGKKGNTIFQQLVTPNGNHLFLTQDGLLLMTKASVEGGHEHGASIEVYSNANNPTAFKITDSLLSERVWKTGFFDEKQNLWLCSDYNVLFISKKEFKALEMPKK